MDGIIFDVDGTLWDPTDRVAASWTKAIRENSDADILIDGARLRELFGKTMDVICDSIFPGFSREDKDRLAALCYEYEHRMLEEEPCPLFDDVKETFEKLSKKTGLYIVSNCQSGYVEILLKTTGLDAFVKDFLCFGDTGVTKDKTIRILMEKNDLADVIYVGDTRGDFDACKEADVPFVFAEYGFGDVPEAGQRISVISDLLKLI